jgi:pSer/pThr/pTyr-binding forkhead associated (FHA) protein
VLLAGDSGPMFDSRPSSRQACCAQPNPAMDEITVPKPVSASELKAVLKAERAGDPFLLYRQGDGTQGLRVLDDAAGWVTLGRSTEADVVFEWDERVSAVHAELRRIGGQWTVTDDGLSTNGTYLNGSRLNGRHRLRDGDRLIVGRTVVLYRVGTQEQVASTLSADDTPRVERLSETQRRVLVALCRPYRDNPQFAVPATNQQIGREVCLGVDAVKTHLRILFGKFGLEELPQNEKRVRLAECALEWGLVHRGEL